MASYMTRAFLMASYMTRGAAAVTEPIPPERRLRVAESVLVGSGLLDEIDLLERALHDIRSWCVDGAEAREPRNVLAQVIAVVDRTLNVPERTSNSPNPPSLLPPIGGRGREDRAVKDVEANNA